jgi:hypothetical protein
MIRIRYAITVLAIILFASVFTPVQAQKPYRLSEQEVKNLLDRVEQGAERYRNSLKDALSASRYDDTKVEDNINEFINGFESATDRLEGRFDDNRSAAGLVEDVLKRGVLIDSFMARHSLTTRAQDDWRRLRGDLDELARAYNVHWTWMGGMTGAYRINDNEVKGLLERMEKNAGQFRNSLDTALDKSLLNSTNAEDNINQFVKDFEAATDRLEDRFGEKRSASTDVEEVLRHAVFIDNFMRRHLLNPRAQSDWSNLRRDLFELALAYRVTWRW